MGGTSGQNRLPAGMIVALAVWALAYVVLDVLTSVWLLTHVGLEGELMGPARALWAGTGVAGLAVAKLVVASMFVVITLWAYSAVKTQRLRAVMNGFVVAFTAYAWFIGMNNLFGIVAVSVPVPGLSLTAWPSVAAIAVTVAVVVAVCDTWRRLSRRTRKREIEPRLSGGVDK